MPLWPRLATYIATSARCCSVPMSVPSSGASAKPTLASMARGSPLICTGSFTAARSRARTSAASPAPWTPVQHDAELVPAEPGDVSPSRTYSFRRSARSISSWSPFS